ncbi:MAG: hypothetical protein ABIB61_04745 [Candidatus Shapirobacteria bacterium]
MSEDNEAPIAESSEPSLEELQAERKELWERQGRPEEWDDEKDRKRLLELDSLIPNYGKPIPDAETAEVLKQQGRRDLAPQERELIRSYNDKLAAWKKEQERNNRRY